MEIITIGAVGLAVLFGLLVVVGFLWGFMKLVFPDFKFYLRYKILKKPIKEEDIEFLVSLIEGGITREHMIKETLLTNKYTMKKAKELHYLFLEVEKLLKGGNK